MRVRMKAPGRGPRTTAGRPWFIAVMPAALPLVAILGAVIAPIAASAAGPAAAPDTAFLRQYAETNRFRMGEPRNFTITPDGRAVLFLRSGARSFTQDLWSLDLASGAERVLASAERLLGGAAEQLTPEEKARRERMRQTSRGIVGYELSQDGRRVLVPLAGRLFVVDRASGAARELKSNAGPAEDPQLSPDGLKVACVRNGDLWVTHIDDDTEHRLTHHEDDEISYGAAEFVAQEEMDRDHGTWWSFDSRRIAFQRTDTRRVGRMTIVDPARPEKVPQTWAYPRPGMENADVTLWVCAWNGGTPAEVKWDRAKYPYLCSVRWDEASPLTLVVMNRRQTELAVMRGPEGGGDARLLMTEKDAAWLNLDQSVPRWIEDGRSFLWSSERGGDWQLELRSQRGTLVNAVTTSQSRYRKLLHVDEHRGVVWVSGGAEPTEQHVFRLPIRPGADLTHAAGMKEFAAPIQATQSRGWHDAIFSDNHDLFVHEYELDTGERGWVVNRMDGSVAGRIRSVAEKPAIETHVQWERVGARDLRALIVRPADFDPARRYPVLLDVYGGPHSQSVKATRRPSLLRQWLANRGFIVVAIDGRGTPSRGRVWERAILNDFISAPLADQVDGLKALAAKHREMDLSRTGIYGWSFGGYFAAMGVLRRPDAFASAVAGAPVVDWRDYDTFYTERYIGLPESSKKAYQVSSVLTYSSKLERPLLVVHGTADDNVYFLNSLKLVDAITRAGGNVDFLPLIGQTHVVAEPAIVNQLWLRTAQHFERTLVRVP